MPSGMGKVPVSGVMAFGRLVGSEAADVAVSPPVTVLVDGATMMVVGNHDSDESVIVEIGTKLLPRLSTVVMLGRVAEVVVNSEVTEALVSVSVAEPVMLGGSEKVVGNSAVVVPASVVPFWVTVASVGVGSTNEVLSPVVGRSAMVVLAVIGIPVLGSASVPVTVVPLPISVALGGGTVEVVMPVPGPVAEGSTISTDDVEVAEMMVVPVPGPVADASIVDRVGVGVAPVPEPVAEASIVDSADVAEVTPVPGPVADGSTVGLVVSVGETISESVALAVGPARSLDRSDKMLLIAGRPAEDGVTIPVGAITMPELVVELADGPEAEGIRPVAVPVSEVPVSEVPAEVALVESAADVGTVSSPVWVLLPVSWVWLVFELGESAVLVAEPVAVVASVASVVRLVGCKIVLGIRPVEPAISDKILLRSEVRGSPVGSSLVSVPVAVADPVTDSALESDDNRLVGWTTSLGTGPVEEAPALEVVVSDNTVLPRSEVRERPVFVSWVAVALVNVVSVAVALGVASEETVVVVVSVPEDGSATPVPAELGSVAEDGSVKVVLLSAEVAVGASSSVAVLLAGGASLGVTTTELVVAEPVLSVSDWGSEAVVIKTGPDGPRLVRMSDNERSRLDEESDVVVSVVVAGSGVAISVTVALVNCLLTSRGKYIFRLATGSAPAKVEAATSAETKSDVVCILSIYWQFIRTDRRRVVCWVLEYQGVGESLCR